MKFLLTAMLLCCARLSFGATTIDFDSSAFLAGNSNIGGNFSTQEANNLTLQLRVDGVLDATAVASSPVNDGIPAISQKWSLYLVGTYANGPHVLTITAIANRVWTGGVSTSPVVVAIATQNIVIDVNTARAYLSSVSYRTPDNTYFAYYSRDDYETLFVKGQTAGVYISSNEANFLPYTPKFSAMYISIGNVLNGSLERIDLAPTDVYGNSTAAPTWLPATLTNSGSYSTLSRTYTVTANVPAGANLYEFQTIFRALVYKNSSANPALGTRPISVSFLTTTGATTPPTYVQMTVKNGIPLVSLTGTFGTNNQSNNYLQGSGLFVFAPNADVDSQNPGWRPLYQSLSTEPPYYIPAYIYEISGTDSGQEVRGGVIDTLTVSLFNPNANLLATENVNFTLPPTFRYASVDAGNLWVYDGTYTSDPQNYPIYTPIITNTINAANRRTWTVTLGQTTQTLQVTPVNRTKLPLTENIVRNLLRSMTYANNSDNPGSNGISRTIEVSVTNSSTSPSGLRTSAIATQALTLVPTNSAPSVAFSGALTVDQSNTLVQTSIPVRGFTIADPDGNNFGATGALIDNPEFVRIKAGNGKLTFFDPLSDVRVVSGNGTNSLLLEGPVNGTTGTLTQVFSEDHILYSPDVEFSGDDTISVTLSDSGNSSTNQNPNSMLALTASGDATVTVTKVNQPAVILAPAARETSSGQVQVIAGINQSDSDNAAAGSTLVQMSLRANNGTVSLASISGLDFAYNDVEGSGSGTGSNDAQLAVRGTAVALDLALAEVSYRSNPNFYGVDAIRIQVNDLGSLGVRRASYLGGEVSAGAGPNSLVTTKTTLMNVTFVNARPTVAANVSQAVPIGASVTLVGGTYVASTNYPPVNPRLRLTYTAPIPLGAGTTAVSGSNLIAQDVETKQAAGLTYTINLPVTQGSLVLQRPAVPAVTLVAGLQFTQDDLNQGYISYSHNGALSGDDGFVFTVSDDNANTAPSNAPGVQVNGATSQQIFNFNIDRTKPIAIFASSVVPVFIEPIPPTLAAPVLLDSDPLTRIVNAVDTTNFVMGGQIGQLVATVSIPNQLGVIPGTISSDPLDTLSILDQAPLGVTGNQVSYNGLPIGSWAGGNGTPLIVTLSSVDPVSVAAVSEVLRHLQFSNPGANPSASERMVTVTVQNGAGQVSVAINAMVQVTPYNNSPTIIPTTRPLLVVPGLTRSFVIDASDLDGTLSFALSGSPPTRGLVTVEAATGVCAYTPAQNFSGVGGVLNDQFEVTATDPGIQSNPAARSATQIFQVRVSDLGATSPVFTSNPPLETVLGRVVTYVPQVTTSGLTAPDLRYSLLGISPSVTPGLGFDPDTGTITWPAGWSLSPVPTADTYQRLGLLVEDRRNDVAAFQPILLKVLLTPSGSN